VEPFKTFTGTAAPLLVDDVNTDQIAPATSDFAPNFAELLFARRRGEPGFVLNQPRFREARILVAGENFGCGSSRESAVWSLVAFGFRCIVARSFADIFRENALKNGLLTVVFDPPEGKRFEDEIVAADGGTAYTVDLVAQCITGGSGTRFPFEIGAAEKKALLEGLDDIGLTLQHLAAIEAWEDGMRAQQPWIQTLAGASR
jgi:3-isopropylmalate dehydratase small subunit